jgi:hypothetical protein
MKCPNCGEEDVYIGLSQVECCKRDCKYFSEKQMRDTLDIKVAREMRKLKAEIGRVLKPVNTSSPEQPKTPGPLPKEKFKVGDFVRCLRPSNCVTLAGVIYQIEAISYCGPHPWLTFTTTPCGNPCMGDSFEPWTPQVGDSLISKNTNLTYLITKVTEELVYTGKVCNYKSEIMGWVLKGLVYPITQEHTVKVQEGKV